MLLHAHTSVQVVKKEYFSYGQPQIYFNFSFKKDFVSLKIPEKGELGGWKITPFYDPPKVSSLLYSKVLISSYSKSFNYGTSLLKASLNNSSCSNMGVFGCINVFVRVISMYYRDFTPTLATLRLLVL